MHTHGRELRQQALDLLRRGARNADVARSLGVPPGTVAYWLHGERARQGTLPGRPKRPCPRCDQRELNHPAYAYLLGLYLGDGHISLPSQHRAASLTITCDNTWTGLMDLAEEAIRQVFPDNSPCRVRKIGCQNVKVYHTHLTCLFPQHGPGKKHQRRIVLEPWQQAIVDEHPWELIRGLIHSDGCRVTNWTTCVVGGERKRYEYPRYFFTNTSDDIRKILTDTLDLVGVEWKVTRRNGAPFNISVARRASVALMDAHIGPKH